MIDAWFNTSRTRDRTSKKPPLASREAAAASAAGVAKDNAQGQVTTSVASTTSKVRDGSYTEHSAEHYLQMAATIEVASEHVLARAFAAYYQSSTSEPVDIRVEPGCGVQAKIDGQRYRIGNQRYVAELSNVCLADESDSDSRIVVYLGDSSGLLARFAIGDEIRDDAATAVAALKQAGFQVVIASGDSAAAVAEVAGQLDIGDWHATMSPADKLDFIRQLQSDGQSVVMVGDGINDAPVLAAADASIALDAGTALARASADAIALGKRLGTIVDAVGVARATRRIIRQNIGWAIFYNLTAVPLAVSGILAPWMAAIGMSLSSLIVVLNALRLHRFRRNEVPMTGRTDLPALGEEVVT